MPVGLKGRGWLKESGGELGNIGWRGLVKLGGFNCQKSRKPNRKLEWDISRKAPIDNSTQACQPDVLDCTPAYLPSNIVLIVNDDVRWAEILVRNNRWFAGCCRANNLADQGSLEEAACKLDSRKATIYNTDDFPVDDICQIRDRISDVTYYVRSSKYVVVPGLSLELPYPNSESTRPNAQH